MKISWILILLFAMAAVAFTRVHPPQEQTVRALPQAQNNFALLGLFISQGCSSCLPADRLLGTYTGQERMIAIACHVDYWNRPGWKDPFSDAAFSGRQRMYAALQGAETVYTPQAVVNGSTSLVGSEGQQLKAAVNRALAIPHTAMVSITAVNAKGSAVTVDYTAWGAAAGAQLEAVLVQQHAQTVIRAGENRVITLDYYCIARDLQTGTPQCSGTMQLHLPAGLEAGQCSIVLLLQEENGTVSAAVKKDAA